MLPLVPAFLAFVVLAAHFFRSDSVALVALAIVFAALLFVRRPWAARAVVAGLLAGTLEWLRTLAALIAFRESAGIPYTRLAVILGAVALVTALCALAFRLPRVRARFGLRARR